MAADMQSSGTVVARGVRRRCAFTLVELLVVVAVIAVLLALLMPALNVARMQARIVRVHSDLRQIGLALETYLLTNRDQLPPSRTACGADVVNQLPVELVEGRYLALAQRDSAIPQAEYMDPFQPDQTYQYRAPGPLWQNGTFFDYPATPWKPRSRIFVPDDFPRCTEETGTWYGGFPDEPPSPVRFATWSVGPDPLSPKFPRDEFSGEILEKRLPLPRAYWLTGATDTGVITHFRTSDGFTLKSP